MNGRNFFGLTDRETEVVRLVAQGHTAKVIGEALGIAEGTVKVYKSRIYERLGLRNAAGLVIFAVRVGLVQV